jgi:hypothetical protein
VRFYLYDVSGEVTYIPIAKEMADFIVRIVNGK